MNVYEAGVVRRILTDAGFAEVEREAEADVLLMMTCSVRSHAEQRALGRIGSFRALRSARPGRVIGVLGCMAQRHKETLVKDHGVDVVVGPDEYLRLPELLAQARSGRTGLVAALLSEECYEHVAPRPDGSFTAFVTVMRGCDNCCSYCIVPYVKGRERSKPFARVLAEIESLLDAGVRDVTLLGQNVLAYRDNGHDFPALLRAVSGIAGRTRVRFLTSHPRDLTEKVVRAMAELSNVCPSLHLPLQSGSDRILKLMNRGYTRAEYLKKIELCRRLLPDLALSTDVLVGFPSETESDFSDTLSVVQSVRFDSAYMFRYSLRPGTKAAQMHPKVSEADSGRRLARLIEVQNRITREWNAAMVGEKHELLIEGPSPRGEGFLGRTRSGKVVIVNGPVRAGETAVGRVTHLNGWTPVAEPVRGPAAVPV
jgi:tRNA-2-methylthio-N6-dimethylallyladenosine synthase